MFELKYSKNKMDNKTIQLIPDEHKDNCYSSPDFSLKLLYDFYYMQHIIQSPIEKDVYEYKVSAVAKPIHYIATTDNRSAFVKDISNIHSIAALIHSNETTNIQEDIVRLKNYKDNYETERNGLIKVLFDIGIYNENSIIPEDIPIKEIYKNIPDYLNSLQTEINTISSYIKYKTELDNLKADLRTEKTSHDHIKSQITQINKVNILTINSSEVSKIKLVQLIETTIDTAKLIKHHDEINEIKKYINANEAFIKSNIGLTENTQLSHNDKLAFYKLFNLERDLNESLKTISKLTSQIELLNETINKNYKYMLQNKENLKIFEMTSELYNKQKILKDTRIIVNAISLYNTTFSTKVELDNKITKLKQEQNIRLVEYKEFHKGPEKEVPNLNLLLSFNSIYNINFKLLFLLSLFKKKKANHECLDKNYILIFSKENVDFINSCYKIIYDNQLNITMLLI